MKSVDSSLTLFISGVLVLEVLLALIVMAMLVVLVMMAVLVVLVMRAVLDVLVVTGSSCLVKPTITTTTAIKVPTDTNTNDATPTIMYFPHFTGQPACASLSSSSRAGEVPAVRMASQTGIRTTAASARGVICAWPRLDSPLSLVKAASEVRWSSVGPSKNPSSIRSSRGGALGW